MNENLVALSPSVNAHIRHFSPVSEGSDLYRVIFEIYATEPSSMRGDLYKEYEVWVTREAVEDRKHLPTEATNEDIKTFAKEFLKQRFDTTRAVPEEDGAYITSATDTVLGNPRTFPLKAISKPKLLKTTIMIPEDTHKWLKEYGYQRSIGIGEAIRRVVKDFQVGTATKADTEKQRVRDTSGEASLDQKDE